MKTNWIAQKISEKPPEETKDAFQIFSNSNNLIPDLHIDRQVCFQDDIEFSSSSYSDENYNTDNPLSPSLQEKELEIDNLVNQSSFNFKLFMTISLSAMSCFIYSFYSLLVPLLFLPIKEYYMLSNAFLAALCGSYFLGLFLGSLVYSFMVKYFKRLPLIYLCLLHILFFHFLLCSEKSFLIFCISRFFISILISLMHICCSSILLEYLPEKYRTFALNIIWLSWPISAIAFLCVCKVYLPTFPILQPQEKFIFDYRKNSFFVAISKFYILLLFFIGFFITFLEDSPRNLLQENKLEKAKIILEKILNKSFTIEDIKTIQSRLKSSNSNENLTSRSTGIYKQLFSAKYISLSIFLSLLLFSMTFAYCGINAVIPTIIQKVKFDTKQNKNVNDKSAILGFIESIDSLLMFHSVGLLILFVGCIIRTFEFSKLKKYKIFLIFISIFFTCMGAKHPRYSDICFGIANYTFELLFGLIISQSSEIYSDNIRQHANAFFMLFQALGGIISQYAFIGVYSFEVHNCFYFFIFCEFVILLIIYFMPSIDSQEFLYFEEEKIEESY